MSKPVLVDGVPHRRRRGKLVPIPPEWLGRTVGHQTVNARLSKLTGKRRREQKRLRPEPRPDPRKDLP